MSEVTDVSNENNESQESNSSEAEKRVPKKAYDDVSKDMHKYKTKTKDLEAKVNEYESKLKHIEEEKLQEQDRWKELYENQKVEIESERAGRKQERSNYLNTVKKSALKSELGNISSEYLVHANLDAVEFNDDGSINPDSVHKVANEFREKHALLIPKSVTTNITNLAPSSDDPTETGGPKPIEKMTIQEKTAELIKLKQS